jgi:D-3-phosphoglycerate dehydrogenase / 2-oxoglutarate reductase
MPPKHSFPKDKIKFLLLENIHPVSKERLHEAGYSAEYKKAALSEEELLKIIPSVHVLGIRSKTQVSARVLEAAKNLIALGCFCIGTNQVDLEAAAACGVPVFNAPFSNTRSVAELTLAEMVMLMRRAGQKSMQLHQGRWDKSATNCYEVRNKTVGIVGYGHIGPQVGVLAEAFGMRVVFYDVVQKLALGNATQLKTLEALLEISDFVTLHVPETAQSKGMIGAKELARMKPGAHLLNLSRGTVVDIEALAAALKRGHIGGAAVDVFPEEPQSNDDPFISPLCGLENVILTPHIGGSTEEAQHNIALEVIGALVRYSDTGATSGAVNFPLVDLPVLEAGHRILNIHRNVPGVLRDINRIVAETGANIQAQYLNTRKDIGYLIMDVEQSVSSKMKTAIEELDTNIRTRVLF